MKGLHLIGFILEKLSKYLGTFERPSPSDILLPIAALISGSKVTFDFTKINIPFTKDPVIQRGSLLDTNSMDRVIDAEGNVILIAAADKRNQKILTDWLADQWRQNKMTGGNIIVYRIPGTFYAIHRIVGVGEDAKGLYFKCKGDNNPSPDPYRIRREHVEHLAVINYW